RLPELQGETGPHDAVLPGGPAPTLVLRLHLPASTIRERHARNARARGAGAPRARPAQRMGRARHRVTDPRTPHCISAEGSRGSIQDLGWISVVAELMDQGTLRLSRAGRWLPEIRDAREGRGVHLRLPDYGW